MSFKNVGIILAGGTGERVGADVPKQMIKVAGTTILEHTVSIFDSTKYIDEIIVLAAQDWVKEINDVLSNKYKKLSIILKGGNTRNETTKNVLDYLSENNYDEKSKLILHDAVRPLLDRSIIKKSILELDNYDAVDVVTQSADTIVEVNNDTEIVSIPNRSFLRRGQTPQSFRFDVLKKAYQNAEKAGKYSATDDCGVVLKFLPEVKIKCIDGSENNIKITHPVDLFIADKLFQLKSGKISSKLSTEQIEHYKDKVVVIFGASYGIGADILKTAKDFGAKVYGFSRSENNVDVSDPDALEKALKTVYEKEGRIDKVVLTAGILKIGRLNDMTAEDVEKMTSINYRAPINLARLSYKYLAKSKGHLLLFASSSYTRGRQNYGLYSSAKAGVVNLAQALSEEWADVGIKINVINPARTATPMRFKAFGKEPEGTLVESMKVAKKSLAIMSTNLTGQIIDVKK